MNDNIQSNPKNRLLELLAKFMDGKTQSWYSCSVMQFSKKKDAETSAASEIDIEGIRTFLFRKDKVSAIQNPVDMKGKLLETWRDSKISTTNYKGQLMESVLKIVPSILTPRFSITNSAPFVCTITLSRRDNSGTETVLLDVVGQGCNRKKEAEQEAAQSVLEDPAFQALQNCQSHFSHGDPNSDVASGDVCCAQCNGRIGDVSSFFFYDKSETEVQFALKPEVANQHMPKVRLVDQTLEKGCRFERQGLSCALCNRWIGIYMKTGPSDAPVSSFGIEKISLLGVAFANSERWRNVAKDPRFAGIEHRTYINFSGFTIEKVVRPHNNTPIKFPVLQDGSYEDSPDYQVDDLLSADCTKEPRLEQLRALHLALQDHMIVVFPTGFGKTFVAAMFLRRFRLLNPSKVVVMVVDRVPLVEQQSRAVHLDTDLAVCPLSGENSTSYVVRELLSGKSAVTQLTLTTKDTGVAL